MFVKALEPVKYSLGLGKRPAKLGCDQKNQDCTVNPVYYEKTIEKSKSSSDVPIENIIDETDSEDVAEETASLSDFSDAPSRYGGSTPEKEIIEDVEFPRLDLVSFTNDSSVFLQVEHGIDYNQESSWFEDRISPLTTTREMVNYLQRIIAKM